ncbi:MAG: glycosyl hydrolase family 18, partial [Bacteroidota bacterium]|nr:glycosyl hydrolase family 18 [Bacteroidota bacterium]
MACGSSFPSEVGVRTDALDDAAWNESIWLSAADAPVVTGAVRDPDNNRAADGANWFVSTLKNERKVISAKWMTTGLGVYQLYVNGLPVGREIL